MPTFRRKLWCWRWAPNRSSPHACESRQRCRGHERGAVVKTIGDAVMATFETPQLEGGRKLKMELVLGALVMIGIFVLWCDVTDSWNNLFRWTKIGRR